MAYMRAHGTHLNITPERLSVFTKQGKEVDYGQWIEREQAVSFKPKPKRDGIHIEDTGPAQRLLIRKIDRNLGLSAPYKNAVKSQERKELEAAAQIIAEQPDADFAEWEEATGTE
jgi:hypothetical protein